MEGCCSSYRLGVSLGVEIGRSCVYIWEGEGADRIWGLEVNALLIAITTFRAN